LIEASSVWTRAAEMFARVFLFVNKKTYCTTVITHDRALIVFFGGEKF
jgi:hypothetical protein